ncbi:MAG: right-handed parallel beta-helix repeat-containing protein [Saprospiraceae bacterium]|nr:right-handed parallel beta-helix repeat-containing protein [Saprospiraceae bacterium]
MSKWIIILSLSTLSISVWGRTFYIDPKNGSIQGDGSQSMPWRTLEEVISHNLIGSSQYSTPYDPSNPNLQVKNSGAPIQGGDTLLLFSGLHGTVFLQNYINKTYITIMGATGQEVIIEQVHFQACKNWRLENVTVSSEPYNHYLSSNLIFLESHGWQGPTSKIQISNCQIYSTKSPWTLAQDWIEKASRGIQIRGDSIEISYNRIYNISFGISMQGDYIRSIGNMISNFSGDGLRILGSHCLVDGNTIKNCYDVDENHDDGIQSFTTNGNVVDDNIVRNNTILNYEDPNQPLLGPLQGIGCFDGFYNNWIVENNLIVVNHWHGITFLGANNCLINNNTVLDPTPDITPGASWIRIDNHKDGRPSTGCQVVNNVANNLIVDADTSHNQILLTYEDYQDNFVNYQQNDFHLIESSILIDQGDGSIGSSSDHDGVARPQGDQIDIGAFEFQKLSSPINNIANDQIQIYPNPVQEEMYYTLPFKETHISMINSQGQVVGIFKHLEQHGQLDLHNFPTGVYMVHVIQEEKGFYTVKKIIKY